LIFVILGLIIIWLVFYDVFNGVVLPRESSRAFRLGPFFVGRVAWIPYRNLARRIKNDHTREDILGNFGALAFLLLDFGWLTLLVTGYACVFWGIRDQLKPELGQFSEAFYFAGTSILTIGFGDVLPLTPVARAVALFAGVSGLALLGLCFSSLFNLQNFLYQREVPIAVLGSRLKGNFSGLYLLLQHSQCGTVGNLRSDIRDWEKWLGNVLESHRGFPLLSYFRSTGRSESWITCLGSMLDMCNILTTVVEGHDYGESRFFHRLGASSVQLLCQYLKLPINVCELMSEEQFSLGYEQLKEAGFTLKDRDMAWRAFGARRCEYATYVSALCVYYAVTELHWIRPAEGPAE
jgi:Ion channel